VCIIYVNKKGEKRIGRDDFKPFAWAKQSITTRLFEGDRKAISQKMREYGIACKKLRITADSTKKVNPRLENGYKFLFYATRAMTYAKFLKFFEEAGTPIYTKGGKKTKDIKTSSRELIAVAPIEQYMISTGRRLFKGYELYDELKRLLFDLETQGLNPRVHAIDQIGIRTNKGFEKILTIVGDTEEERRKNELLAIIEFLKILRDEKPDIIAGHNSENFDWNFIIVRLEELGTSIQEISEMCGFNKPIHKRSKEAILKLGGEMEAYHPTVIWGHNVIDSLHAVRRAQAIDSNMQSASLKYVTKYLKQKKDNRVYVPGNRIGEIWRETDKCYAFNNTNGDWYKITEKKQLDAQYELTSGRYIVERYLLDDLWETDKVELKLNESNFLVAKILPTNYSRACTMGTAGIWKLIMYAWCYENNLAIPSFDNNKTFTGGLSRLLRTGYVKNIVKLDFNSLYPSIILSWLISSTLDITDSMLTMLNYVLTERERYKKLKKIASKEANKIIELFKSKLNNPNLSKEDIEEMKWKGLEKEILKGNVDMSKEEVDELLKQKRHWDAEESSNDKKQLPLKIVGNSYFGSFGAPAVFPFGDLECAEMTTCIGRMSLRLMISHFSKLGYTPIVGDSFTSDTPVFIKNKKSGLIDIKPICELINVDEIKIDGLGREYDTSKKDYQVLCRSGWCDVKYIYRHKTDKPIYEVLDGDMRIEITEDHSIFNSDKKKIKPSEITRDTELEYYTNKISGDTEIPMKEKHIKRMARMLAYGKINVVPNLILNGTKEVIHKFMQEFLSVPENETKVKFTKTLEAQLQFLTNKEQKLWI
ncbi:MAG: hypothetical protein K2M17_05665, partial [Bacilli bacterium]|nr:hypothetical protein [Bacilli bacterium]